MPRIKTTEICEVHGTVRPTFDPADRLKRETVDKAVGPGRPRPPPSRALTGEDGGELGVEAVLGQLAEDAGGQCAVLAHEHALRQADYLEGAGGLGALVDSYRPGAAVLAHELPRVARAVVDQHAEDNQPLRPALVEGTPQQRELAHARPAPGRPEAQQHRPATI